METLMQYIGPKGIAAAIGLCCFFYSYRHSIKIFDWIEDQTFGTRNYILTQLERLFIDVKPQYITYALLGLSFGLAALVFGIFLILGKIVPGLIVGVFVGFIGWKIPKPLVDHLVKKRIEKYKLQMTDALQLLSNGLRAGLSVPQALGMVVDELPAPVAQEFNLILQESRVGSPLEECFENLVKRVPTEDNQMFVSSVNILRETGGNLAEVFDTICAVIRERVRLQQKIDTYVAQGMIQGITIFCMPTIILLLYSAQDPETVAGMFQSWVGILMLVFAYVLNFIGGFVILKVVQIKV